jgi:hypothetical protein
VRARCDPMNTYLLLAQKKDNLVRTDNAGCDDIDDRVEKTSALSKSSR